MSLFTTTEPASDGGGAMRGTVPCPPTADASLKPAPRPEPRLAAAARLTTTLTTLVGSTRREGPLASRLDRCGVSIACRCPVTGIESTPEE